MGLHNQKSPLKHFSPELFAVQFLPPKSQMENGDESDTKRWACKRCGHVGLEKSDGFYYCQDEECGKQADDLLVTGVADEDFIDKCGGGIYNNRYTRRSQLTQTQTHQPSTQAWLRYTQDPDQEHENNNISGRVKKEEQFDYEYGLGPMEPGDFGGSGMHRIFLSYEDYYNEVRFRYVMGMQWLIQLQCEALVENFNVSPLICGISGVIWLRFLSGTGVFKDNWADEVVIDSENQIPDELVDDKPPLRHRDEPRNANGERSVMIWFKYLRKAVPLSSSLAISFLACHVAREAILSRDIVKWSLEGKLPYFAAHVEIEKRFERSSPACPITSSLMFRPSKTVPVQKLEPMAAAIAESIGLHLPPVNFYGIASRYLKVLVLQEEKILPYACRIYEWSMPPDLWLSTNVSRRPTRICVMSILIVAIRILYNLHGFGVWERNLFCHDCSPSESYSAGGLKSMFGSEMRDDVETVSPLDNVDVSGEKLSSKPSNVQMTESDSAELLHHLAAKYSVKEDTYEFTKDLPSYLQYCKDVVFAGAGQSRMDGHKEEEFIEKLWVFYSKNSEEPGIRNSISLFNQKRLRYEVESIISVSEIKNTKEECDGRPSADIKQSVDSEDFLSKSPLKTLKDKAIRRLKLDMEETKFCYIPPRENLKKDNYLHYVRKRDGDALTYAAHADYYILLRACAQVAQVDIRIMHTGVLRLERRLAWLEKRIDHCLHLRPPTTTCEFCRDPPDPDEICCTLEGMSL
ncbi:TATA box-binding protein-associated factor RNA polymerase I subunit B-like [Mercurialis annua]|uniref:TATA box-binding protein-associated factor RNA polymerase I subunit B-like n=1 Tax=Mercurialis annua TaxID=3986 RepID=UPI00215F5AD0|nr:TATA box-binding protein-associated factor RNA polymerase I subunit B-like [Mercurialis annua]